MEKKQMKSQRLRERYEQDMQTVHEKMNQIMVMIQGNPRLANIKPEILVTKKSQDLSQT
jgi:hypothetical protein